MATALQRGLKEERFRVIFDRLEALSTEGLPPTDASGWFSNRYSVRRALFLADFRGHPDLSG
jgi:hypothetical protein